MAQETEAQIREALQQLADLAARESLVLKSLSEIEPFLRGVRGGRGAAWLSRRLELAQEIQGIRVRRVILKARLRVLNFSLRLPLRGRPLLPGS